MALIFLMSGHLLFSNDGKPKFYKSSEILVSGNSPSGFTLLSKEKTGINFQNDLPFFYLPFLPFLVVRNFFSQIFHRCLRPKPPLLAVDSACLKSSTTVQDVDSYELRNVGI